MCGNWTLNAVPGMSRRGLALLLGTGVFFLVVFVYSNKQVSSARLTNYPTPEELDRKIPAAFTYEKTSTTLGHKEDLEPKDFPSENARRLARLHDACRALENPSGGKRRSIKIGRFYHVCVPAKCGTSSWRALAKKFYPKVRAPRDVRQILVVRNPLSRLISTYRDKYLNGATLSTYTNAYQRLTHSFETWSIRWRMYWLPALISRGDIKSSEWVRRTYVTENDECGLSLSSSSGLSRKFSNKLKPLVNYAKRFRNTTFSFLDFLKHVLWTRDHGVIDKHWTHQYCICNPCEVQYDFMLDTENVGEESRHVFDKLNIAKGVHVGSVHSTKKVLQASDAGYFDSVPKDIMDQILLLYKRDFELLGFTYCSYANDC